VRKAYNKAEIYRLFSVNKAYSRENDENVVKPPSTPVVKNALIVGDTNQYEDINSVKPPIAKHPTILTTKI
jgi:hypothetical protein